MTSPERSAIIGPAMLNRRHHRVTPDLARRRALLIAALGFALLRTRDGAALPETEMLRRWLDSWRGVGDVVTGMNRQGYMLHLSNVDAATWRATFSREVMLSSDGFGDAVARGAGGCVGGAQVGGMKPRQTGA